MDILLEVLQWLLLATLVAQQLWIARYWRRRKGP